jgi:hypothetical protein
MESPVIFSLKSEAKTIFYTVRQEKRKIIKKNKIKHAHSTIDHAKIVRHRGNFS